MARGMSFFAPPFPQRPEWQRLVGERHDLLVVGGGVHGAGVARDAALRGWRVALVEGDDWASGTSSRSSRLLHGGLRYLRQGSLGLVQEALRERDLHLRLAPGLAHPLTFRVPRPLPGTPSLALTRAGIALYGLLARSPRTARFWTREPTYEDAWVDDARLVLALMLDARRAGALALNYVVWREWVREGDRVVGARVQDRLSGAEGTVHARFHVNAAGPWADYLAGERRGGHALRLTRGTHVVLGARADGDARLFFSPEDGRVLFLLPFDGETSFLGTTDLDEATPVKDPMPREDEVLYLRRAFAAQFPQWKGWPAVGLVCGLRPLLAGQGAPSALSREERILEHPSGTLISILGGKLTTYRAVAERVADGVDRALGRPRSDHPTRVEPLAASSTEGDALARVRRAFAEEDAVRLEDVFLRRTTLGHRGAADAALLRRAGQLWRLRWGRSEAQAEAEVESFSEFQARRLAALRAWYA